MRTQEAREVPGDPCQRLPSPSSLTQSAQGDPIPHFCISCQPHISDRQLTAWASFLIFVLRSQGQGRHLLSTCSVSPPQTFLGSEVSRFLGDGEVGVKGRVCVCVCVCVCVNACVRTVRSPARRIVVHAVSNSGEDTAEPRGGGELPVSRG